MDSNFVTNVNSINLKFYLYFWNGNLTPGASKERDNSLNRLPLPLIGQKHEQKKDLSFSKQMSLITNEFYNVNYQQ